MYPGIGLAYIHSDKFQKHDKVALKLKFKGNLRDFAIKLHGWENRNENMRKDNKDGTYIWSYSDSNREKFEIPYK